MTTTSWIEFPQSLSVTTPSSGRMDDIVDVEAQAEKRLVVGTVTLEERNGNLTRKRR